MCTLARVATRSTRAKSPPKKLSRAAGKHAPTDGRSAPEREPAVRPSSSRSNSTGAPSRAAGVAVDATPVKGPASSGDASESDDAFRANAVAHLQRLSAEWCERARSSGDSRLVSVAAPLFAAARLAERRIPAASSACIENDPRGADRLRRLGEGVEALLEWRDGRQAERSSGGPPPSIASPQLAAALVAAAEAYLEASLGFAERADWRAAQLLGAGETSPCPSAALAGAIPWTPAYSLESVAEGLLTIAEEHFSRTHLHPRDALRDLANRHAAYLRTVLPHNGALRDPRLAERILDKLDARRVEAVGATLASLSAVGVEASRVSRVVERRKKAMNRSKAKPPDQERIAKLVRSVDNLFTAAPPTSHAAAHAEATPGSQDPMLYADTLIGFAKSFRAPSDVDDLASLLTGFLRGLRTSVAVSPADMSELRRRVAYSLAASIGRAPAERIVEAFATVGISDAVARRLATPFPAAGP